MSQGDTGNHDQSSFFDQLYGRKYGNHQISCTGLKPLTLHVLLVEGAAFTGQMFQSGKSITSAQLITDASGKIVFSISMKSVYYKTYKFELTAPNSYASATTVLGGEGTVGGYRTGTPDGMTRGPGPGWQ